MTRSSFSRVYRGRVSNRYPAAGSACAIGGLTGGVAQPPNTSSAANMSRTNVTSASPIMVSRTKAAKKVAEVARLLLRNRARAFVIAPDVRALAGPGKSFTADHQRPKLH